MDSFRNPQSAKRGKSSLSVLEASDAKREEKTTLFYDATQKNDAKKICGGSLSDQTYEMSKEGNEVMNVISLSIGDLLLGRRETGDNNTALEEEDFNLECLCLQDSTFTARLSYADIFHIQPNQQTLQITFTPVLARIFNSAAHLLNIYENTKAVRSCGRNVNVELHVEPTASCFTFDFEFYHLLMGKVCGAPGMKAYLRGYELTEVVRRFRMSEDKSILSARRWFIIIPGIDADSFSSLVVVEKEFNIIVIRLYVFKDEPNLTVQSLGILNAIRRWIIETSSNRLVCIS